MKDECGSLYIVDALLALSILFIVLLMLNTIITLPYPSYSQTSHDFNTAQDIMEILSGKVDFEDKTFLGEITEILKDNEDSDDSVRKVSAICKSKFREFNLTDFKFVESNHLDSKVLASSGTQSGDSNVSVATRSYGDYSYTLYIW